MTVKTVVEYDSADRDTILAGLGYNPEETTTDPDLYIITNLTAGGNSKGISAINRYCDEQDPPIFPYPLFNRYVEEE